MAGEDVRGHPARRAGTDDDRVVGPLEIYSGSAHRERLLDAPVKVHRRRNCSVAIMPKNRHPVPE